MAVLQSTPRRSVAKQAATARRLNASSGIAQHVLDATIEIANDRRDVIYRDGKYADLFFVRSGKFAGRYYVVTHRAGVWTCTARDNANYFIGKAQVYLAQAAA